MSPAIASEIGFSPVISVRAQNQSSGPFSKRSRRINGIAAFPIATIFRYLGCRHRCETFDIRFVSARHVSRCDSNVSSVVSCEAGDAMGYRFLASVAVDGQPNEEFPASLIRRQQVDRLDESAKSRWRPQCHSERRFEPESFSSSLHIIASRSVERNGISRCAQLQADADFWREP